MTECAITEHAMTEHAMSEHAMSEHAITEEEWAALLDLDGADAPPDGDGVAGQTDRLAHLMRRPGPDLVLALAQLDPQTLTPPMQVAYVRATEAALAWLAALQSQALVALAGAAPRIDEHVIDTGIVTIEDAARSEIAAATRWSESWAAQRIRCSRILDVALPGTRAALASGEITARHADAICSAVMRLGGYPVWLGDARDPDFPRMCAQIEGRILPIARRGGVSATRRAAERALQRADSSGADERRRRARRTRDVWIEPEADGMALLMARMGVAEALGCLTAIDTLARNPGLSVPPSTPGNAGIGERRAEALASLLLADAGNSSPRDSAAARVRVHVNVVIDLDSLLGLADSAASISASSGPGGEVCVSAGVVRELIRADGTATLRRLIVDPLTGHVLDRGRRTYAVPPALRQYLIDRDVRCRFPGCTRRADLGQADHATPWSRAGSTDRANLGMVCTRHHQLKTHSGWRITESSTDGSCRWLSPAGIEYLHGPVARLEDVWPGDAPGGQTGQGPDPPPF